MSPPGAAASMKGRSARRRFLARARRRTGSPRSRPPTGTPPPPAHPQAEPPPGSRGEKSRQVAGRGPPPSPSAAPARRAGRPGRRGSAGGAKAQNGLGKRRLRREPPATARATRPALAAMGRRRSGPRLGRHAPGRSRGTPVGRGWDRRGERPPPARAPPLQGHRGRQSETAQAPPPPEPPNHGRPPRRDPATGSAEGQKGVARLRPSAARLVLSAAFPGADAVTWLGRRGRPRGEAGASGHRSTGAPWQLSGRRDPANLLLPGVERGGV